MDSLRQELEEVFFNQLIHDLTECYCVDLNVLKEVSKSTEKSLQYNMRGGKLGRAMAVVMAYTALTDDPTDDDIKLAQIMGWCVELLQAAAIVADDIIDQSVTRRGRPCWFRVKGLAMAFNDSMIFMEGIFVLMKKYFSEKPYYEECVELFRRVAMKTAHGESMDLLFTVSNKSKTPNCRSIFEMFNEKNYEALVRCKTSYYTFYLTVGLALLMAGRTEKRMHQIVEDIMLNIGHYFQVQDDYLDCYGDSAETGKIGTDIQEGKLTWFIVTALGRCNSDQRAILEKCYGSSNEEDVAMVKNVYEKLNLHSTYLSYEDEQYKSICEMIDSQEYDILQPFFRDILNMIYRRSK